MLGRPRTDGSNSFFGLPKWFVKFIPSTVVIHTDTPLNKVWIIPFDEIPKSCGVLHYFALVCLYFLHVFLSIQATVFQSIPKGFHAQFFQNVTGSFHHLSGFLDLSTTMHRDKFWEGGNRLGTGGGYGFVSSIHVVCGRSSHFRPTSHDIKVPLICVFFWKISHESCPVVLFKILFLGQHSLHLLCFLFLAISTNGFVVKQKKLSFPREAGFKNQLTACQIREGCEKLLRLSSLISIFLACHIITHTIHVWILLVSQWSSLWNQRGYQLLCILVDQHA